MVKNWDKKCRNRVSFSACVYSKCYFKKMQNSALRQENISSNSFLFSTLSDFDAIHFQMLENVLCSCIFSCSTEVIPRHPEKLNISEIPSFAIAGDTATDFSRLAEAGCLPAAEMGLISSAAQGLHSSAAISPTIPSPSVT